MDSLIHTPWTTDRFLAWEDAQEGKHEFDGARIVDMTGGTFAHQQIVFNLRLLLMTGLPAGFVATHEMRVRIGAKVRYPDVCVVRGPITPTIRTLTDAAVIFEVLSDDTAAMDKQIKPAEYATIPSLQYYILVDQEKIDLTVHARRAGNWQTAVVTGGVLQLGGVAELPVAGIYQGLRF